MRVPLWALIAVHLGLAAKSRALVSIGGLKRRVGVCQHTQALDAQNGASRDEDGAMELSWKRSVSCSIVAASFAVGGVFWGPSLDVQPAFAVDVETSGSFKSGVEESSKGKSDPVTDDIEKKISSNGKLGLDPELDDELEKAEEDMEMSILRKQRKPDAVVRGMRKALAKAAEEGAYLEKEVEKGELTSEQQRIINNCRERVLTLKAYLDEAERDLFNRNWENLQVYLYTFADQEDAFVGLINGLFPNKDPLDGAARQALSYEAQSMFLNLEDLREAAKVGNIPKSTKAYANLLLSYDRFLKAGDLYDTYDPITSTAIFFRDQPLSTLEFDKSARVQVYDNVLLLAGPDMGKTGTVINIEDGNAVVKLDKDGKAYQEVKQVQLDTLAKAIETDCDEKCLKEREKVVYAKDKENGRIAREKGEKGGSFIPPSLPTIGLGRAAAKS